jgi:hypothetical protein
MELAKGLFKGLGGIKTATLEFPGLLSETGSGASGDAKKIGEGVGNAIKSIGGLFGGGDDEE